MKGPKRAGKDKAKMEKKTLYIAGVRTKAGDGREMAFSQSFGREDDAKAYISVVLDGACARHWSTSFASITKKTFNRDGMIEEAATRYFYEW